MITHQQFIDLKPGDMIGWEGYDSQTEGFLVVRNEPQNNRVLVRYVHGPEMLGAARTDYIRYSNFSIPHFLDIAFANKKKVREALGI